MNVRGNLPAKRHCPAASVTLSFLPVNPSATDRLLCSAAVRIQTAAFGRRLHVSALALCALALVGLLCARLLSLLPNGCFTPLTSGLVPVLAVLIALVFLRRPAAVRVARAVDERAGSKELFLTASLIGHALANIAASSSRRRKSVRAPRCRTPFSAEVAARRAQHRTRICNAHRRRAVAAEIRPVQDE